MSVAPAVGSTFGDAETLAPLKRADRSQTPEALRETARQFESLFTRMLLKSMRATSFDDSMTGQGEGFYRDLFDDQLAIELSKGKGLGLADMLVEQLKRAGLTQTGNAAPPGGMPDAVDAVKHRFVQELWPHAEVAGAELGVDPRTLIAHAALETGWGRHLPQGENGRPSHNYFGIKATAWNGASVEAGTTEFAGGVAHERTARFRAYGSPGESFRDYVALIRDNPRYAGAKGTGADAASFARALQAGGYATDPDYAAKLARVASVLKFTPAAPISGNLET